MLVNLFSMGLSFGMFLAIFLSYLIVLLFSFSVHEFSHAFAAYKHGDYTAKYLGRMTLNPFAHFNASGFICLILFGFGWANPVPVNPYNYKNGKKSMFAVAFGGILANLILVTIFTFAYTLIYTLCPQLNPVNITYVTDLIARVLVNGNEVEYTTVGNKYRQNGCAIKLSDLDKEVNITVRI